jgi:C-5 cytosine-specific DNA methylase
VRRPVALDLCCGLGGWSAGLVATGWHVVGVDIEDMFAALGEPKPEHFELVIGDICKIKGADYAHVSLIVGSSPCTEFSWRAMPWKRAKAKAPDEVGLPVPEWWSKPEGKMTAQERCAWASWKRAYPREPPALGLSLYNAQFRIQREASEAAGRHIPMVCENVRGAQPWVGKAKWSAGSMYFWGDIPALMPQHKHVKVQSFRFDGSGRSFQTSAVKEHAEVGGFRPTSLAWGNESRWFNDGPRNPDSISSPSSSSPARKAASARIAKIPRALSEWIGWWYLPPSAREERTHPTPRVNEPGKSEHGG